MNDPTSPAPRQRVGRTRLVFFWGPFEAKRCGIWDIRLSEAEVLSNNSKVDRAIRTVNQFCFQIRLAQQFL